MRFILKHQSIKTTSSFCVAEKITFTNAPSPQEFTEGDNANIVCDVISSPPPSVFWKYKGAKIQMEKDGKSSQNSMMITFLFPLIW